LKAGDVNGDGQINGQDASAILYNWNDIHFTNPTRAQGDLTGDGNVDGQDASVVLFNWGK